MVQFSLFANYSLLHWYKRKIKKPNTTYYTFIMMISDYKVCKGSRKSGFLILQVTFLGG